jgi:hypothetical protein
MDGLVAFTIFLIFFIIIWFLAMNRCVKDRHSNSNNSNGGGMNNRNGYMLL